VRYAAYGSHDSYVGFPTELENRADGKGKGTSGGPPLEDNFRFLFHENVGRVKG